MLKYYKRERDDCGQIGLKPLRKFLATSGLLVSICSQPFLTSPDIIAYQTIHIVDQKIHLKLLISQLQSTT